MNNFPSQLDLFKEFLESKYYSELYRARSPGITPIDKMVLFRNIGSMMKLIKEFEDSLYKDNEVDDV
jgi:hypothetical protein